VWQVCLQLFFLLSFSVDSIAVAAQALVATELGAGSPDRARRVAQRAVNWGAGFGVTALGGFAATSRCVRVCACGHVGVYV